MENVALRRLVIRSFHVKGVEFADKFEFSYGILKIDKKISHKRLKQRIYITMIKKEVSNSREV